MDTLRFDRLSRIAALAPARRREPVSEPLQGGEAARTALLGAEVARNHYGEYLVARRWYATPEMCVPEACALRLLLPPAVKTLGKSRLQPTAASTAECRNRGGTRGAVRGVQRGEDAAGEFKRASAAGQKETFAENAAGDPAKWLFLDIETTGLAGGSGTYAFLVGLAWWDGGGITVEQLFMRDHGEEHAILLEIANRMRERPVLVTFNGKSFGWPLLETRFRMTRAIDPPEIAAHLDMLHPSRQLWRVKLGTARLAELEERVLGTETLGWSRSADIDSSRIPEFYFTYLRGGSAEPLAGVFRHNCWDLRGLAALAGRIFRSLADPETIGPGAEGALELYGVSRLLYRRGERERAEALYERALAAGLPRQVDRRARHELARLVKRQRNFVRAADLWRELSQELAEAGGPSFGPSFEACEQLAIDYERRLGDAGEAARVARQAMGELRRARRQGLISPLRYAYFTARFERRVARLGEKMRRAGRTQRPMA